MRHVWRRAGSGRRCGALRLFRHNQRGCETIAPIVPTDPPTLTDSPAGRAVLGAVSPQPASNAVAINTARISRAGRKRR